MRHTCSDCGKWVKDKLFFGTLHVCVSEEERAVLEKIRQQGLWITERSKSEKARKSMAFDAQAR